MGVASPVATSQIMMPGIAGEAAASRRPSGDHARLVMMRGEEAAAAAVVLLLLLLLLLVMSRSVVRILLMAPAGSGRKVQEADVALPDGAAAGAVEALLLPAGFAKFHRQTPLLQPTASVLPAQGLQASAATWCC